MPDIDDLRISLRQSLEAQVKILNKPQFRLDQFNYSGVFEVSSLRMHDH